MRIVRFSVDGGPVRVGNVDGEEVVELATPTMTRGESFDTRGPMGPWVTTADEVPDPHDLPGVPRHAA